MHTDDSVETREIRLSAISLSQTVMPLDATHKSNQPKTDISLIAEQINSVQKLATEREYGRVKVKAKLSLHLNKKHTIKLYRLLK
jgi:hypothetical protein